MRKTQTIGYGILALILALALTACQNPIETLPETATGSISGQITVDGQGAMGFIVSVEGTPLMAITCEDGMFAIQGVPAGDNYRLIATIGDFTAFFYGTFTVLHGEDTRVAPKVLSSSVTIEDFTLPLGRSRTIILPAAPTNAPVTSVTWSSSNPDAVSIDAFTGRVTAHDTRGAVITATSLNGSMTKSARVNVVPSLPSLHLSIEPYERGGSNALHRTIWRSTTVSLRGSGIPEDWTFENVNAEARGRGNATWVMSEKRPLRIRFLPNEARPMFGSNYAARNWTLIANALDHTLMRNYSANFLGRLLVDDMANKDGGMIFSPTGHFVHLYMDGEYRGVYMLSDQMNINDGRMNLTANNDPEQSEYFLEWCFRVPEENVNTPYAYFIVQGIPFSIGFPGGSILRQDRGHQEFAKEFLAQADKAMASGDFSRISQIIDIPSFIDYYLVQELFKNWDIGFSSIFFQIRQMDSGPKLFAGPLWDFDVSSGSRTTDYHPIGNHLYDRNPQGAWVTVANRFFKHLMQTDWFRAQVGVRWNEIKTYQVQAMLKQIKYLSTTYQACFEHNFDRWPSKRVSVTPPYLFEVPFMGQVEYLTNWLQQRKAWMDKFLQ